MSSDTVNDVPLHELGELVGQRFRIEQILGQGAMGVVYRVRDERSARVLALKRLVHSREQRRELAISLFEHEFHTLAGLSHPCIVGVHDYGLDERGAFYTMELLEGADLRELGKLPWHRACELLRDVASALAILHSRRLLHRDLSARNVRCTNDGRAKLIDFGAMAPIGIPRALVGTPPFVSPEAWHFQALDARTDLFSLGALAYRMLTGEHAFSAQTLGELPDVWKTAPRSPAERDASVPSALSELVLELLRLDRGARPSSAAAVMERLCGIAGIPMDEHPLVSQAYLTMPVLVGRGEALSEVREAMSRSSRKRGGAVLVLGESGSGRTRFLDACVLEAKLCGACVLLANPGDGGGADYAIARALARQLLERLPELAREAARPWRSLLAHVLGEIAPESAATPEKSDVRAAPERRHLQAALRDWFVTVARTRHLTLVVDDFDRVDEPSAALLAILAHHAEKRMLSVVVSTGDDSSNAIVRLMARLGTSIRLSALSIAEVESLVRSLFGDADNVLLVARRIFDASAGNPRSAMQLAQHLVDRRLARYEAGSWVLPGKLDKLEPPIVAEAQLGALSETARALVEILSLAQISTLSLAQYTQLLTGCDHRTVYRALDELVAAGILTRSDDAYAFTNDNWLELSRSRLEPARRRELELLLADVAERSGHPVQAAHHCVEAGQVERAVRLLRARLAERSLGRTAATAELLERVLGASAGLQIPLVNRIELEQALLSISALIGEHQRFARRAPELLEQLKRDSGLLDWHALAAEGVPEAERLARAFERSEQRRDSSSEVECGLPIREAIGRLARLCSSYSSMATITMDLKWLRDLPSFLPFAALSPLIALFDTSLTAVTEFMTSHPQRARRAALDVLERLKTFDARHQSEVRSLEFGMLYMLGAMDAYEGLKSGAARVEPLESVPGYRATALRVRRVVLMMQGDFESAREYQRRAELFELQDGEQQVFPGTVFRIEAAAQWMVSDLVGLKQSTERIFELSRELPGWRDTLAVARAHYKRLQGQPEEALVELQPALARVAPGTDPDWPWVAAAHVSVLSALNRHAHAAELGLEYLARARTAELSPAERCLIRPTSDALVESGRVDEAAALAGDFVRELEADGVQGLWLGLAHEGRAYVAIAMRDTAAFGEHAGLAATEYRRSKNSSLVANYERLLRTAKRAGLRTSPDLEHAAESHAMSSLTERDSAAASAIDRLSGCATASERARCVLELLLERSRATGGHLYGLRSTELELVASEPDGSEPPAELKDLLRLHVQSWKMGDPPTLTERRTEPTSSGDEPARLRGSWVDPQGRRHQLITLIARRDGGLMLAAVAALNGFEQRRLLDPELAGVLAASLLEHTDVDPLTVLEVETEIVHDSPRSIAH